MMEHDTPFDDADLAAYLAGDTDELTTHRIESALARDPALGARLDRLHGVMVALREPDRVPMPAGLTERIGDRVAEKRAARGPRPTRRVPRAAIGAVAAGVLAFAVIGGNVLGGADVPGMPSTQSADESAEDTTLDAVTDDADGEIAPESSADRAEPEAAGALPTWPREEAVRRSGAREIADQRWEELEAAGAGCRSAVEDAVDGPAVPRSARPHAVDGRPVIDYEIASGPEAAEELTGSTRVRVEASTCTVVEAP